VPSRLANAAELEALLTPLKDLGAGVGAFTPGERVSHAEVYELQRRIGRPFTWTALLTFQGSTFARDLAAKNAAERAEGVDVWPQITCRPLTFQMTMADPFTFNMNPAFTALMDRPIEERLAAYHDAEWRRKAQDELDHAPMFRANWDRLTVAECERQPEIEGRSIAELAAEQGEEPLTTMLGIAGDDLVARFGSVLANNDPEQIEQLLQQDGLLIGLSDAGAHVSQLCDACLPTDLLGNWVREREVLTIEHAVQKLTGEPAGVFGFDDRGEIAPGKRADVTVFDPATVAPGKLHRVRDFPADGERLVADEPSGVTHVLVNGTTIRVDGEPDADGVAARPGQLLRNAG
jgi:N-acyl-D-aspartate/D-glutamate deacylase